MVGFKFEYGPRWGVRAVVIEVLILVTLVKPQLDQTSNILFKFSFSNIISLSAI